MNAPRPCVLGCRDSQQNPRRAAPGLLACNPCADTLAQVLTDIGKTYAHLTDIHSITPSGSPDGSGARPHPGPRSPAVDTFIALSDPRTTGDGIPGALNAVTQWAHLVRAEQSLDTPADRMRNTVPADRATMTRELATLRFHWHWILAQPWLPEFASKMRGLLKSMNAVGQLDPPTLQIGTCPKRQLSFPAADGKPIVLTCGAPLRVRVDADEIKCTCCRTVWPRSRWHELGDGQTDYAQLSDELGVTVGTLRRWASEDEWTEGGTARRRLVLRLEAHESYRKRRGALPLEQAG